MRSFIRYESSPHFRLALIFHGFLSACDSLPHYLVSSPNNQGHKLDRKSLLKIELSSIHALVFKVRTNPMLQTHKDIQTLGLWSRARNSIRRYVGPSVRQFVHRLVGGSVHCSVTSIFNRGFRYLRLAETYYCPCPTA